VDQLKESLIKFAAGSMTLVDEICAMKLWQGYRLTGHFTVV
jgi:hypothetical protein